MNAFSNSWRLVKASLNVLRSDTELLVFPLLSTLALIVVTLLFALPIAAAGVFDAIIRNNELTGTQGILTTLIVFLMYVANYFVIIYFNTALVGAAMIRLRGGDPTLSDGIRIASSRLGAIFLYALISATVGMILRAIRGEGSRQNLIGSILAGVLSFAWNVVTFLVIPILAVEGIGPVEAIKRSASLLRKTWGEQLVGNFGIGAVFFVIILGVLLVVGVPIIVVTASSGSAVFIIAGIVLLVVLFSVIGMVSSAVSNIYATAVYRYAAEGEVGTFFDTDLVRDAFRPKDARPLGI
jgi:hypothetical protein